MIFSFAVGLLLCFVAGLWAWLRAHERPPHALSSLFAFGAVAFAVLVLAGFVPIYLLSYPTQPATVAGPLGDLGLGLLARSGIPTAVCLAAYAALVIWQRCLPLWTAWLAIGAALAHDLIAASFVSHGPFLSVEGSVIVWVPATLFAWILATSTVLLRTRPEARWRGHLDWAEGSDEDYSAAATELRKFDPELRAPHRVWVCRRCGRRLTSWRTASRDRRVRANRGTYTRTPARSRIVDWSSGRGGSPVRPSRIWQLASDEALGDFERAWDDFRARLLRQQLAAISQTAKT